MVAKIKAEEYQDALSIADQSKVGNRLCPLQLLLFFGLFHSVTCCSTEAEA